MYSFKLLSHPETLLVDHLENVYNCGIGILEENRLFLEDKEFLKIILIGHDLGKATSYFQDYIKKIESHGSIKNHGFLSALFTYSILQKKFDKDKALKGFLIVKRHHGNIQNMYDELSMKKIEVESQLETLDKQLKTIDFRELNLILEKFNLPYVKSEEIKDRFIELFDEMEAVIYYEDDMLLNIEEYFKLKYFYSILIYSDKFSVIFDKKREKSKEIKIEKLEEFIEKLPKCKNIINDKRNEARINVESKIENLNKKIFTLTLPTGMGKTLNSLNFALKLREKLYKEEGIYYNIIYTFPFTSIIDQTYEIFQKIFGNRTSDVLKHHYLSKVEYKDDEDYFETEKSKFLIETWDSKIVVTTFVKLLQCIFSNKNSELLKFNKLANCIVILDEVQNIPYKYWKLIRQSFEVLSDVLNTYFILMTATQPLIFKGDVELVENTKEYFKIFKRTKLNIDLKERSIDEFIDEIEPIIKRANKIMIVLNTVKSAQEVYKQIKSIADKKVIFLSASVIPKDRKERILEIKKLDKYILVSTQVVEAGVDIDNDVVIRDIGPWDSIVQCAGRCNRNNERDIGNVYIYKLKGERNIFANIVYGRFLISKTEKILKDNSHIFEHDFFDYSKYYFEEINKDKSDDYSNRIIEDINQLNFNEVNNQFKLIENNSLYIMPVFIEKDEEATYLWTKYEELFDIKDRFERMNKFLEIKEKFLSYVININIKDFPFVRDRFYGKIPIENLDYYYSDEYGFITDNDQTMFF
ncbi:CRISPR-associated endonuclease/helicase Cas3 [Caloranaerobacter azorensis DSM 13643]|uniref:CRISPR-associated endonuclease/helicase Cas3 n=1 Tax=Caloranaerobacter azorensis DSM 13643 TaxID=1121264 RepID=A0A1M5UH34_9FIRM|nr:CRISPR-associated helicase/endonuclease Cas3 [Caloranaerobacter azorensis]SHH62324.1 CRISPR-associated endonuclease/helicase Cas3 [Caloranaerobacter azorensis DSM 13643]